MPHFSKSGALLITLLLLPACADQPVTSPDPQQLFAISDGAHDGNPHFYFLNPLVPAPSPTGVFDGSLEPEVEICPLDPVLGCGAPIALFTTDAGHASETVRMDPDAEHYVVNWHSADFDLDTDATYRIRVLAQGRELGFGDVDVVTSGKELKNVATDEYIPLKDGRTLPIKFRIEEGAVAAVDNVPLEAGFDHSCALDDAGTAYCWGSNAYGQLGDGTQASSTTPVQVAGGLVFSAIQAGRFLTCGLTAEGDGYCWGYNAWGQVGTGTAGGVVLTPTLVSGGRTWTTLTPGRDGTCGLTTDDEVWCWGHNGRGVLGRGFFSGVEPTPMPVTGGQTFQSLSLNSESVCALTSAGEAYCWGGNAWGRLGDGTFTNRSAPTPVVGGHVFAEIHSGLSVTCAITQVGAGYCWGENDFGATGVGYFSAADLPTPQAVVGGHDFRSLRSHHGHTCGVVTTGEGYCWGLNGFGQLGIGAITGGKATPQLVAGGISWDFIDLGYHFTCGKALYGDIYCWGLNSSGAVGDGSLINRSSPVLALDLSP